MRAFLASDAITIGTFVGLAVCTFLAWRVWRSPQSWHIDGDSKELRFHAWPEILMAGAGACAFALLTFLTF